MRGSPPLPYTLSLGDSGQGWECVGWSVCLASLCLSTARSVGPPSVSVQRGVSLATSPCGLPLFQYSVECRVCCWRARGLIGGKVNLRAAAQHVLCPFLLIDQNLSGTALQSLCLVAGGI